MLGSTIRNPTASLVRISFISFICTTTSAAFADTIPVSTTLSMPIAGLTAAQGAFVDAQLATSRAFVAQEIAASQSVLATLMAENATAPNSWMVPPQTGTVQSRLADYAETMRTTLDGYGDLLRLRHNKIGVEFDARASDMAIAFLSTGFILAPPDMVPIGQTYAPVITVPSLATGFPGLTPVPGGFFSSASHQP